MNELTPREVVAQLDRHIVGQADAKRAVAVAVRNRWRRARLPESIREEVLPKNIIMIGPTGVGKTEIARRLANLVRAPFVKVEASKFTEVGYVGRDVETIVRDLMESAVALVREEFLGGVQERAREIAEDSVLDALLPHSPDPAAGPEGDDDRARRERTRGKLRGLLEAGALADREVEIQVRERSGQGVDVFGRQGFEQTGIDFQGFLDKMYPQHESTRRVSVAEALKLKTQEAAETLVDKDQVVKEARRRAETSGVVFLDELDKVTGATGGTGPDISREGVQRDLLPIVEGSAVPTRHGIVKTDHVLFVAAGAFHVASPSDLIPELQGRFPIRVQLDDLGTGDFVRILTEPENALTRQYAALLGADGVKVTFTEDGIEEIAETATRVNRSAQNIGARRLFTLMERVLEEASFLAPDPSLTKVRVDASFVRERLEDLASDEELARSIL